MTDRARTTPNLTELELLGVATGTNVADGHARQGLSRSQQKLVERLPDLFEQAVKTPAPELELAAREAFLPLLGQHAAITDAEVLSCYSSSVALEILGRALYADGLRHVSLVQPTFDNIPDILRGIGMRLTPLDEDGLYGGSAALPPATEVLFVTTPNNPTGRVLPREQLAYWAEACASRGIVLVLDASFRGFDVRAQYDHYEILGESGCRYVVVEDTGKLWPTLDLKVGFLAFRKGETASLRRVYTDILLGVSPFILLMVQRFAEDADAGGLAELHGHIHRNRTILRDQLAGLASVGSPDPDTRVSVERLTIPDDTTATRVWHDLSLADIHVLPCRQFHWAEPDAGERFIRVALGRPPEVVASAAGAIRGYLERR